MHVYRLFSDDEARDIASRIAGWSRGVAANDLTVKKYNDEATDMELSSLVRECIKGCADLRKDCFVEAISDPKFNRYREGGEYAVHTDAASMQGVRTDLACTLFLSDDYEGGELCANDHEIKLSPGECVAYECWRPHYVKPVTKGERIAAIWWMQSYIQEPERRELLNMLRRESGRTTDVDLYATLGSVHEKLVKMWWR